MNTQKMTDVAVFENKEFGEIRTVTVDGEPWFVGKDVATALGYMKPENAISTHVDAEDKTSTLIQGSGSNYKSKTTLINESGLYSLILSSKLPKAKEFKHWVTDEVLPAIRKKGYYINPDTVKIHNDPSVPLTREELAMYFTYFVNSSNEYMSNTAKMITDHITAVDKRLDVLTQGYDDLRNTFNSLRSGYQTVLKGYTNSESRATALETALTDYLNRKETSPTVTSNVATPVATTHAPTSATPDSIFTNSLGPDATTAWVKDVWCAASAIAAKSHTDSHDALREIYKIIRQNGIQLSGLYGDWKQNNPHRAMVNMISESDYLRGEAEKAIHELYDKYYPERNEKKDQRETTTPSKIYKSQLLMSTPAEVRKCIEAVSNRDNLVYNRAAASVYREIERRIKEDLRLLADNFAENEGYMHCSKAYYISQKPELMKVLGEISGVKLAA